MASAIPGPRTGAAAGGGGVLPRTTPHVSSAHHRLMRQGPPQPASSASNATISGSCSDRPLAMTADVQGHSTSSAGSLPMASSFHDASSSRSTTPHPFVLNSLKRQASSQLPVPGSIIKASCAPHFTARSAHVSDQNDTSGSVQQQQQQPQRWTQHLSYQQQLHHHQQQQQPLWAGPSVAPVSLRNPALPYHTGQAIARPSKSTSLPPDRCQSPLSPPGSVASGGSSPAAAMSFFARAAQRFGAPSRRKKHRTRQTAPVSQFPTNFRAVLTVNPPPSPADLLLQSIGRMSSGLSAAKVKVMLRVCPVEGSHSSILNVDSRLKQVILFDPSTATANHSMSQRHVVPPKMFAFDAVFTPSDPLAEVCAAGLVDIIQSVVGGVDGCLFCYGHARIGKTYTMLGVDESPSTLGVIPCAIDWLFRLINDQKERTGARFSVRVSAVEITGKQEMLKDLLADIAKATEASGATSPGVYLRDDPVCGTQLENQSELRAPTAEHAAHFLDAAIAARTVPEVEDDARNSHLLFTIHVYQYRLERTTEGQSGVAGGRSRLHLLDIGSCSRSKDGTALSLSALGTVLLALLNGQRHLPYRESKLTQVIKESMSNARSCMIAHVSPAPHSFNETLQVLQLASRIHRMRGRKKTSKLPSTSSEDSSSCSGESGRMRSTGSRLRLGVRMGTMHDGGAAYRARRHLDYTSSSEQSCDTVIYIGSDGKPMSDRELTDCEGPPRSENDELGEVDDDIQEETVTDADRSGNVAAGDSFEQPQRLIPRPAAFAHSRPKHASISRLLGTGSHRHSSELVERARDNSLNNGRHEIGSYSDGVPHKWALSGNKDTGGEMWIDGPKSIAENVEQWVDGPPAFQTRPSGEEVSQGTRTTPIVSCTNLPASSVHGVSQLPQACFAKVANGAVLQQKCGSDLVESDKMLHSNDNCTTDSALSCNQQLQNLSDGIDLTLKDDLLQVEEPQSLEDVPRDQKQTDGHCIVSSTEVRVSTCSDFEPQKVKEQSILLQADIGTEQSTSCHKLAADLSDCTEVKQNITTDASSDCCSGLQKMVLKEDDQEDAVTGEKLELTAEHTTGKFEELFSKPKLDITSLLLANRESIYELQMDEELETGSRESLQQLVCGSDDDWSTWGSCRRKSSKCDAEVDSDCELRRKYFDDIKVMSASFGGLLNSPDLDPVDLPLSKVSNTVLEADVMDSVVPQEVVVVEIHNCPVSDSSAKNIAAAVTGPTDAPDQKKIAPETLLESPVDDSDICCLPPTVVQPATCAIPSLTPANKSTRVSILPKPATSSQSRLSRKPPPIPVRSSSQPSAARSGSWSDSSVVPAVTSTSKLQKPSIPVPKNGLASRGLFLKDSSPATKETKTKMLTFGGKSPKVVVAAPAAPTECASPVRVCTSLSTNSIQRPSTASGIASIDRRQPSLTSPGSLPPPSQTTPSVASKMRSRIALPSRKDKKSKPVEIPTTPPQLELAPSTMTTVATVDSVPATPLRLMSPYHKVTQPRAVGRSSGSHCSSDNSSSVFSDRGVGFTVGSRRRDGKTRSEVEASSGYESMIRDSEEVTGTSSNQDSANESQSIAKLKGTKTFRKRVKGRSRSVPTRGHLPDGSHIPRPWAGFLEEPVEIKVYDVDDVERMARWRQQEAEVYQLQSRRQRIQELLDKQKLLKRELSEAKAMLMVDSSSWSYDLHVAEDFQRDDSDYLAALETETAILEKRVRACRSRIMVVTVFDITAG